MVYILRIGNHIQLIMLTTIENECSIKKGEKKVQSQNCTFPILVMILEDLEKPVPIKMAVSKRLCSPLLCQQQTRSFKHSRSDSQKSL